MDWKKLYQERLITADEAVKKIKSGDKVSLAQAAAEPLGLVDAMIRNKDAYEDVDIFFMIQRSEADFAKPGVEKHFCVNSTFLGPTTRESVKCGHGNFIPAFFYATPALFETTFPLDVALLHVTPPDKHGYVSLGVSVDYSKKAAETAKIVIAQVNKNMPRTHGMSFLHVEQIDYFVEHDAPILELPRPNIGEVELAIGKNCATLVKDGDTLQLGIGAIPDAVLLSLKDKKDLGIHSEMVSDGLMELIKAGVVNCRKKNFNNGKCIVTFLMGSTEFYDFVDDNPLINVCPVDYVNDPQIASQNDNMCSINSCVEVDFMGQVSAESIGPTQITGIGGQMDFVRSATMSKGGRSIIAMPSTAAKGKVSRIVPALGPGTPVTTSRNDVQYVVTEYGIAELRGHTLRDRARSLIKIAHPNFQEELKAAFKERFAEDC